MFNVFIVLIALPHIRFLEEMLPKFPLTFLKLIFNVYLNSFLFLLLTPELSHVLYSFGFVKGSKIHGCYTYSRAGLIVAR